MSPGVVVLNRFLVSIRVSNGGSFCLFAQCNGLGFFVPVIPGSCSGGGAILHIYDVCYCYCLFIWIGLNRIIFLVSHSKERV